MSMGLVAKPVGATIPWTTPPIIAGFLASGGRISGAVIQVITIAINVLIYYPFFKLDDNAKLKSEKMIRTTYMFLTVVKYRRLYN